MPTLQPINIELKQLLTNRFAFICSALFDCVLLNQYNGSYVESATGYITMSMSRTYTYIPMLIKHGLIIV